MMAMCLPSYGRSSSAAEVQIAACTLERSDCRTNGSRSAFVFCPGQDSPTRNSKFLLSGAVHLGGAGDRMEQGGVEVR